MRVIQSRLIVGWRGAAKILELQESAASSFANIGGKTNAICDRGAKYEHRFFRAMIFFFGYWFLVTGCWQLQTPEPATSNQQPATSNQQLLHTL
jgi:hypothetical protein